MRYVMRQKLFAWGDDFVIRDEDVHSLLDRSVVDPLRRMPIAPVLAKGLALLAGQHAFIDYPVTGAVLYALALWELTGDRDAMRWERAVHLLVLAERFSYNRMLPSLGWAYAAEIAEQRCPGLMDSVRAELAATPAVELRETAHHVVAEML